MIRGHFWPDFFYWPANFTFCWWKLFTILLKCVRSILSDFDVAFLSKCILFPSTCVLGKGSNTNKKPWNCCCCCWVVKKCHKYQSAQNQITAGICCTLYYCGNAGIGKKSCFESSNRYKPIKRSQTNRKNAKQQDYKENRKVPPDSLFRWQSRYRRQVYWCSGMVQLRISRFLNH